LNKASSILTGPTKPKNGTFGNSKRIVDPTATESQAATSATSKSQAR